MQHRLRPLDRDTAQVAQWRRIDEDVANMVQI